MTNRPGATLVEILSIDVFRKGNKKSEQFSVKQKIKVREAGDVNREKQIWERNFLSAPQLPVLLK